jgi:4'-phosphopantetheinyl transferase
MREPATESERAAWSRLPERLEPEGGAVHVWRAELEQPETRVKLFFGALSDDERQRAERFHFNSDRKHFIVARGVLRALLGFYLGTEAAQLRFSYSPFGKPFMNVASGERNVRFNVSHSRGVALYAFADNCDVGIDVEYVRADFATAEIAERFFSSREVEQLCSLDDALRAGAFFNCWTRKEAYIKARGEGLSYPLQQFTVSLLPGERAALLDAAGGGAEISRWSFQELAPKAGYAAAVVTESRCSRVKCFDYVEGCLQSVV